MSIQCAYKNSHTRNSDTQLYMTKLKLTGSNFNRINFFRCARKNVNL